MAIRFTEAFSTYWNHMVHSFREGDVLPGGEFANHLLATGSPVVEETASTPDVTGDGVPDGTAVDVLGWVGDDSVRAAQALEAEQKRDKPRSTLAANLQKLAGKAASDAQHEG